MTNTYTTTAKALHWLIAVLIFCMIPLGFVMTEMDFSPEKLQYYSWHKWAGVSVFLLSLIRLVWRVLNPPPELPEQMNQLLKFLAHIGHYALYLLCFIIPVSGLLRVFRQFGLEYCLFLIYWPRIRHLEHNLQNCTKYLTGYWWQY